MVTSRCQLAIICFKFHPVQIFIVETRLLPYTIFVVPDKESTIISILSRQINIMQSTQNL